MKFWKFWKFKKKKTYYWGEPKWTAEMLNEIENIFKDYEIVKCDDEDGVGWDWEIQLNTDVYLSILLDCNRDVPYLAFFSVEADLAWKRHTKTWLEFEHCEEWEYLLERLKELPGAYGYKALGKSYSRYCMDKID